MSRSLSRTVQPALTLWYQFVVFNVDLFPSDGTRHSRVFEEFLLVRPDLLPKERIFSRLLDIHDILDDKLCHSIIGRWIQSLKFRPGIRGCRSKCVTSVVLWSKFNCEKQRRWYLLTCVYFNMPCFSSNVRTRGPCTSLQYLLNSSILRPSFLFRYIDTRWTFVLVAIMVVTLKL